MKKFLVLLLFSIGLCCVSCYDDSPILERLDALEKNAIASINEQISAIKASITSLEAVDVELKSTIKALEAKADSLQGDIDVLKEVDASLETKIEELKTYVDEKISNTEDWATATFATLEQYDSLCVVLTGIETSISDLKEEFTKNLSDAISDSEESMKSWVNEQLTGYWTIAETQARLDTLKHTHNEDIEKVSAELADAKKEMTEAYTTAISNAIEELGGKLSDEITKINDELTKRVNDIEDRLSAIEETLKNLIRDFSITFDDYDIGILAGGTTSVGYTITGATEKTTVKALGQNGWSAKVTPDGTDKGKITVTAPDPLTEDEIIVLVYDGEFRTIMSSINFVTGVVTPSQTAVELEAEAGTFDITITSNLDYKISIPENAKDWLSVIETKSMRDNVVSFSYNQNDGFKRYATILIEYDGTMTCHIDFIQLGLATEVFVENPGTLASIIEAEDLLAVDKLKISGSLNDKDWLVLSELNNVKHLDLSNITNESILKSLFKNNTNLITLILPQSLTEIPESICEECTKLKTVTIPKHITRIGKNAFKHTYELNGDLIIPDSVIEIMDGAFDGSHSASYAYYNNIKLSGTLYIGKSVQSIGDYAFFDTGYDGRLTIPNSVQSIGIYAFNGAFNHTGFELNANIKIIREGAFRGLNITGELIIPEGVEIIEAFAFEGTDFESIKFPTTLKELSGSVDRSFRLERKPDGGQFSYCSNLSSIDIPKTITYIPYQAFAYSGLIGDLIIPDNIIEVGCGAFSGTKITTVTLGKNVKYLRTQKEGPSIDGGAWSPFVDCNEIDKFYSKSITPPICEYPLTANKYLGVPKDAIEAYKTANIWKEFSVIEGIDFEQIE